MIKLYDYIQYRISSSWYDNDVQNLINRMKEEDDKIKYMTGAEIVAYIKSGGSQSTKNTLAKLLDSFRRYCRLHHEEAEPLKLNK